MKKLIPVFLMILLFTSCAKKAPDISYSLPSYVITYDANQAEHEEIVETTYGTVTISAYDEPLKLKNADVALTIHNALNAKIADVVTAPEKYGIYFDKTAVTAPVVVNVLDCSLMNNIASYHFDVCVYTNEVKHADYTVFDSQTWSIGINFDLNTGKELLITDLFAEGTDYEASISQYLAPLNIDRKEPLQGLSPRGFYLSPNGLDILAKDVAPVPFIAFNNLALSKYSNEILWADETEVKYQLLETPLAIQKQVDDSRPGLYVETIKLVDGSAAEERVNSFIPSEYPEGDYEFRMNITKYGNYISYNANEYHDNINTVTLHLLDATTGQDVLLSSLFVEGFEFMPLIQNEVFRHLNQDIPAQEISEKMQFSLDFDSLKITFPSIPNSEILTIPFSLFGYNNMAIFK